jgi:hypothetical protein
MGLDKPDLDRLPMRGELDDLDEEDLQYIIDIFGGEENIPPTIWEDGWDT